jgi:hypothetical protein
LATWSGRSGILVPLFVLKDLDLVHLISGDIQHDKALPSPLSRKIFPEVIEHLRSGISDRIPNDTILRARTR